MLDYSNIYFQLTQEDKSIAIFKLSLFYVREIQIPFDSDVVNDKKKKINNFSEKIENKLRDIIRLTLTF